jgi:enoyl-CoA hydratase
VDSYETILVEREDGVALVTLNRPKVLNALNQLMISELRAALAQLENDAAVRVVILTGAGERAFAAGADIAELNALPGAVAGAALARTGQGLTLQIERMRKPVIAAVNGFALGGGCETAMACTIRIASEHARFGQPEVKLGLVPGGGGTQRLPRLVGRGRALQLILTGGTIDAQEAWRIGLVNEVVPAADLIARAEAVLAEIFANAPIAVSYALDAVNRGLNGDPAEGLALEAALFGVCAGTADKAEGAAAFLEKRAPAFQGR